VRLAPNSFRIVGVFGIEAARQTKRKVAEHNERDSVSEVRRLFFYRVEMVTFLQVRWRLHGPWW
jgi:hypothetical protein